MEIDVRICYGACVRVPWESPKEEMAERSTGQRVGLYQQLSKMIAHE